MPLSSAIADLSDRQIPYSVISTAPARKTDSLDEGQIYVIRQVQDIAGVYHLTVAAKMVKGERA